MKEVIFKLPDEVLTLIIHKVANTPQEASLLEKWIYDGEERKTGKWIPTTVSSGRDSWTCSVCGRRARGKTKNLPYCHCGAKMEVDK